MVSISTNKIFFSGGIDDRDRRALKSAYTYDFYLEAQDRVEDMIQGRCFHAMVHVEGNVYVFGGENLVVRKE